MAAVRFERATRCYPGAEHPAVDGLELTVDDGELMVLVGPSGCGKTTSLRMVAGLEPVDSGRIHIGDRDVTDADPKDRDIAMVFQNYALYPHMTVAQNMGFALKVAKTAKAEIRSRVHEAARLLDLEALLDRKPKDLSGGQRQRVAMGRAIVRHPQVFLMDEPLSNLDAKLRVQTRNQIAQLQRRLATTTVYVTHDQVEAMTMGDRVAVLCDGVLQQCAAPRELYRRPANTFVAGFVGSPAMNLFSGVVRDGAITVGDGGIAVPRHLAGDAEQIVVGVRPEHLGVDGTTDTGADAAGGIDVVVDVVEDLGADAFVYAHLAGARDPQTPPLVARVDGLCPPRRGDRLRLRPAPRHLHYFDAAGRRRD
ncbi:sn-glycerol-3-phosphate ABC transporter ATP-binding protein UgpC [Mycolicibacillus parakoreensis]|uniref:Sn-glycerol-3-phosphate ABC transporter ATP-binding protein UgpC n=2 Tax=Mycobacteriaceae TaxID=1762 RepID=A0ABY3U2G7_9MYCO|nr:sn-glycerol-3-phosphate ABC transporter ATP-binding protein UgpC [Mycolicibacillus parakoreensis]MCV7313974.1 sn-glycerol-3-phosphate ABC transporter ATP-binding protein UgpC [Mycolicibacillus parakoreensis]ULN54156.1 sn-glycerol-3-phosphate ABC transporter ATP-binding protein UgpC [Mycolicibacillus parakoreensis]